MKRILSCTFLFFSPLLSRAQTHITQQGTIVRMRMTDCLMPQHGFMAAMSSGGKVEPGALCPEYVLVTDKIVYVISGRSSDALIPLAETTRFRMQKNEMLIRIDDAAKESRFQIKTMMLRPEWDHKAMLEEMETAHHADRAATEDH